MLVGRGVEWGLWGWAVVCVHGLELCVFLLGLCLGLGGVRWDVGWEVVGHQWWVGGGGGLGGIEWWLLGVGVGGGGSLGCECVWVVGHGDV